MKTIIFGAFALAFAVPAVAQSVPLVHPSLNAQGQHQHDPKTGDKQHANHEQHCKDMMAKMHKDMKHDDHGKADGAKPAASGGSQDHSGHAH